LERDFQALQAVIWAGADVRMERGDRSVGVLGVEALGEALLVSFISNASPQEQRVVVAALTPFVVVFAEE
jgi:hypothetical protein